MAEILKEIANCIERGKVEAACPHPADMAGRDGAGELTQQALEQGITANEVLSNGLIVGMQVVGERFRDGEIYLPDVLMSAKAMQAGMEHLRPYFLSGDAEYKGAIVMGTVSGDLHDIGKRIVAMFFEGNGWKVIDLGVDVSPKRFLKAVDTVQPRAVGLSALLTTTMPSMADATQAIKNNYPDVKVLVGGAPLNQEFADKIGADAYSPDPQGALDYLARIPPDV